MIKRSDAFWPTQHSPVAIKGVKSRDASWGFVFAETRRNADYAETILKFTGMGLFPLVGALLAFSAPVPETFGFDGQVSMFFCFALVGTGLYAHASRGLRNALEVDTSHAVFRLGTENIKGDFSESAKFRFMDVESIFLMREHAGGSMASLQLRRRGTSRPVFIMSGPEHTLVRVLERTTGAVRRQKGLGRVRTKTTGRFVHVNLS